ncbi:hypothetical protein PRK78_003969 [Emydomyces testavorans]|uniref:Uncharacterized protein n=1 Tax=Emydomyces testavorans TaxID=2070801 RepID=A0AAF0DH03_9EURO|nr:hypothetical protein PRK78_003969 [Emydomyces testavorans]
MASPSSDRVIWLCLGVPMAEYDIYSKRQMLRQLQESPSSSQSAALLQNYIALESLQKSEKARRKTKLLEKLQKMFLESSSAYHCAQALKLDTLLKLSESSSFDLRAAALRIVSERATKGSTRDLLLEDLSSRDLARRRKALNALHFLVSSRTLEHTEETSTTISPILPKTRPLGENKALATLNVLLPENVLAALEAGVVSRWLAKYPFPCAAQEDPKRRRVVPYMKTWSADDPLMSSIIGTLVTHHEGVKQLRKYGLMGSRIEESKSDMYNPTDDQDEFRSYIHPGFGEDDEAESEVWILDEDAAGTQPWSGRRPQEGTAADQAIRRRRREAIVFSEGGRPLGRDNIIEPIRNDEDESLEDQSDEIQAEANRDSESLQTENNTSQQNQWRAWLWPFS